MKAELSNLVLSARGQSAVAGARTLPRVTEAGLPSRHEAEPVQKLFPEQPAQHAASAAAVVAQANQHLQKNGRELTIEFNDDLGRSVFKLVDSVTGEVLRQIPTEEALAVARALAEGQGPGSLLDARV